MAIYAISYVCMCDFELSGISNNGISLISAVQKMKKKESVGRALHANAEIETVSSFG